jgi:acetolactate synthase-1/2/3 large subunit
VSPALARSGGEILADALVGQGVGLVFCVPGESFLPFLAAAHQRADRLKIVSCRQEGGAAYMAEAAGKLTGRPGVCFVTRGPGACNAAVGVHTAFQDSTPMLLLIGQVARGDRGREAFQELDYGQMYGALAKHVEEIDDPARIPESVARAFAVAQAGRAGPVVLVFPEDVLAQTAEAADLAPVPVARPHPAPHRMDRLAALLAAAERPLVIVGGSGWDAAAAAQLRAFAEAWQLPVAAAFRCQDILDNESPSYAGELGTTLAPALGGKVLEADLLLTVGARLSEMDTQGYTLIQPPSPRQGLIHVYPVGAELGRVYQASLPIHAAVGPFAAAAAVLPPPVAPRWAEWTRELRRAQLANRTPGPCPGALDMGRVIEEMAGQLPDDAIICHGAGNYTGWVQRYYPWRRYRTQISPLNGSMGYGLPAAVAAKLLQPERPAVALAGDGCFLMTGQELATAMACGVALVVLVINNGMYGTIRMHQERTYPGRTLATDLVNPDFVGLARSYGAWSERVERTAEFAPAFARALAAGRPAVLELKVDPEAISTRTTLSALRNPAT